MTQDHKVASDKRKIWWAIASALSLVYAFAFYAAIQNDNAGKSGNSAGSDLLFGFCVWGKYEGGGNDLHHELYPDKVGGCHPNFPFNSHYVAFIIDVIMTLAAAGLYFFKDDKVDGKWWMYVLVGGIILMHGGLHIFLQVRADYEVFGLIDGINCYYDFDPPSSGTDGASIDVEQIGYIIFFFFSLFLSIVIMQFGFPDLALKTKGLLSLAFAIVVVILTQGSGGELILPGLFVVAHPVSCVTGLLSKQPAFNATCARLFALCTAVGILELTACGAMLRPIGGHFWYDLTLHAAVLASLPCFDPPTIKGKED